MSEQPLDRMNYYNGQRLEASDFRTEQDYLIRTRRWLNRSLYTAGIARGLMVSFTPGRMDNQRNPVVTVSEGLALDYDGNEIILVEATDVPVTQSSRKGGDYLVIQYGEQLVNEEQVVCPISPPRGLNNTLPPVQKGMRFVRAEPVLSFTETLPKANSNQVALAQVELTSNCTVVVDPAVRRYIGALSDATVRQYALEGEKDIDPNNPKRIYFHVHGRQPNSVTLYLRAARFSTLYYTEMGKHDHNLGQDSPKHTSAPDQTENSDYYHHQHPLSMNFNGETLQEIEGHIHGLHADYAYNIDTMNAFSLNAKTALDFHPGADLLYITQGTITDGGHKHQFSITGLDSTNLAIDVADINTLSHTHTLDKSLPPAGATDLPVRVEVTSGVETTNALQYIKDLHIYLDGNDVTQDIVKQLQETNPKWTPPTGLIDNLGDGFVTHPIVVNEKDKVSYTLSEQGTGAIHLDFLPNITFAVGEHWIDLSVANGGGRIEYNLYVE